MIVSYDVFAVVRYTSSTEAVPPVAVPPSAAAPSAAPPSPVKVTWEVKPPSSGPGMQIVHEAAGPVVTTSPQPPAAKRGEARLYYAISEQAQPRTFRFRLTDPWMDLRSVDPTQVAVPGFTATPVQLTSLPFFRSVGETPRYGARFHDAQTVSSVCSSSIRKSKFFIFIHFLLLF